MAHSQRQTLAATRAKCPYTMGAQVALLALIGLLWSGAARADGLADEAELQFQLGVEKFKDHNYRGALENFLASNRLVPNRNVKFNIGRMYELLKQYPEAHRYYLDALAGASETQSKRELAGALARIGSKVAVLDVETTPPGATVYVNRRDLGSIATAPKQLALPQGRYKVIVDLEGYESQEQDGVKLDLGDTAQVRFTMKRILGQVRISGEAGMAVRLEDERASAACTSPCDQFLTPGEHVLYFTREGFETAQRVVKVPARGLTDVFVRLTPLTGSIIVSADEPEALIEVDGKSVGFTPAVVQNVAVGQRHVRVSLPGFVPVERDVQVETKSQAELRDLKMITYREVSAASRFAESIDDAPSSVTIISSQELQAFGYPTIAEALRGVRGVSPTFDSIYSAVEVRGLGRPNDYGVRLLVLQDGITLNENVLGGSYVGYDGRTDLEDIERIEVIRGPGSVLYGTGAVSGVVNLVSKSKEAPTTVHASVSTYENAVARLRGDFRYKTDNGEGGVWASVSGGLSPGYRQNVTLRATGTTPEQTATVDNFNKFHSISTAGGAFYKALSATWFATTRSLNITSGGYGVTFNDPRSRVADDRLVAEVKFDPKLSDHFQLMTRLYGNIYRYHAELYYDDPASPFSSEWYRGIWFGAEARGTYTLSQALRISLGGEYQFHPHIDMQGYSILGDGERDQYLNQKRALSNGALYLIAEGTPIPWFRFSAGVRLDLSPKFGAAISPRVALIFKPNQKNIIKVMGGRAFRAPSDYELFYDDGEVTQVASNKLPGNRLLPESFWSAELEYTLRVTDDWSLLASGHFTRGDGLIETIPFPGNPLGAGVYVNSTTPTVNLGADFEVRKDFRRGWMLAASYSFLSARYLDSTQGVIPNAPMHSAGARAIIPLQFMNASLAFRTSVEGPRRLSLLTNEETKVAVISDIVLTGHVPLFGVRYSFGVYNLFGWRLERPVTDTFPEKQAPQGGRTFMAQLSWAL